MKWNTKCFFVSSHTATSNHTHYPIANSVYMNKYSLHVQTQPMLAGCLDYGRQTVKWATDYFLKAHTAPNEFYGQVGLGHLDHAFWGRPEDMTMARPAFKIDASNPGKLASRSFFPTFKSQLSSGESTACAKDPRHSQFWYLQFRGTWQTLWFKALYCQRPYSKALYLIKTFRTLKQVIYSPHWKFNFAISRVGSGRWDSRRPRCSVHRVQECRPHLFQQPTHTCQAAFRFRQQLSRQIQWLDYRRK